MDLSKGPGGEGFAQLHRSFMRISWIYNQVYKIKWPLLDYQIESYFADKSKTEINDNIKHLNWLEYYMTTASTYHQPLPCVPLKRLPKNEN